MNNLTAFFKKFRTGLLSVVLAGVLLMTTACGVRDVQARVPGTGGPEVSGAARGGMNDYSDIDPRQDTTRAQAKAKALQDSVERNVNTKRADDFDQYAKNYRSGTPLGERTERAAKGFGEAVEGVKDDAQDLGRTLSNKGQEAASNTRAAARDAAQDAQRAADRTSNFVQDKTNQAARGTQRSLDRAADNVNGRA
jgi:hypothetical protein